MTLVEPGPVLTEFERKVYEDARNMDLSGTDDETARIFREVYLPYSEKVFSSLGQSPEEVAEVRKSSIRWLNCYSDLIRHEPTCLFFRPLTYSCHIAK